MSQNRATGTAPPLSVLTVSTLYPNPAQPTHGIFVETRLLKLVESGAVRAHVLAPIPWVPSSFAASARYGKLHRVPSRQISCGLTIEHPRYLVVPKVGMSITPWTLFHAMRRRLEELRGAGHRFDLIDAHYFYPDGVAAVWLGAAFALPVVVTARGTDLNLIPEFRIPRRLIRDAAARADGLITVCAALKERLVALGTPEDRITVLRNGVDLERFRPTERALLRARFGLTRRSIASVGHLIDRKGHHHVIRALADLSETDLLIVGDGPCRPALEALARKHRVQDRVRFLGVLDQPRLAEVYNAVDALVLASSREGWANVLLEAMACGTPVVASAVWGTPEVVARPEAGVLMPSLDAAGVVRGIQALFASLPRRAETRAYAEQFDWKSTTDGQIALFDRVMQVADQP